MDHQRIRLLRFSAESPSAVPNNFESDFREGFCTSEGADDAAVADAGLLLGAYVSKAGKSSGKFDDSAVLKSKKIRRALEPP